MCKVQRALHVRQNRDTITQNKKTSCLDMLSDEHLVNSCVTEHAFNGKQHKMQRQPIRHHA